MKWVVYSHGFIILKLQLPGHLFVVLPCLGTAFYCVVRDRHLPPRSGHPVDLHLHVADALADLCGVALECENAGVVVVVDGNSGGVSFSKGCLRGDVGGGAHRAIAGGDGVRLQYGNLSSVGNPGVAQTHVKVLIFFEDVIVNDADGELLCGLTRLEHQGALSKLIVGPGAGSGILCAVIHLWPKQNRNLFKY